MVWTPGQRLNGDRYIIEDKLGEGGFGVTYLAQKAQNRQQVVIKTLKDELLSHPNFSRYLEKIRDEALLLAVCEHHNIVKIDAYFTHDDFPCIAMEYVAGEDLWKWVEMRGILSETEALNYIRQVGEAVTFVQKKGLLHRDIKPQNIMVRDNQDAVLIDFGLARGFIPNRTQQITVELTQGFAPPEQYGRYGKFDQYTDVYALAATLYYLLTKTSPTGADLRGLKHPLKSPLEINSCISDEVNEAILQGMEMEAIKRPQSVQEWLAMLPQPPIGNERPKGVVPPTIPSPQPPPQPVNLISAKGVDYGKLDRLLASGEWKEADQETKNKMLEVAGRTKDRWLDTEDIDRFPCEDLRTIDQLWVKYSNGRFGFSVQKRIYESLGGSREYDPEIWKAFGDRVGWRVNKKWLYYNQLKFNTKAPVAHLPRVWRLDFDGLWWVVYFTSSLASRLVKCNL